MAEIVDPRKDLDANALLQEHGKGISSLDDRVGALEKKLSNPELLAKTLEEAASDSKKLDKLFSKLFCDMMKNDETVKSAITEKIAAMDRDAVKAFWTRFGRWVLATIGGLFAALLGGLIDHYVLKK